MHGRRGGPRKEGEGMGKARALGLWIFMNQDMAKISKGG